MIVSSIDYVAGAKPVSILATLVCKRRDGVERHCGDLSGISAVVEE